MSKELDEFEEKLEKRKNRYNPRGGAIHPEETYRERNFWDF